MDSAAPRKRSKLSLVRARRAENTPYVDNSEVEDAILNSEPPEPAVIDLEANVHKEKIVNEERSEVQHRIPVSLEQVLAKKRLNNQPYRPLPPMKVMPEKAPNANETKSKNTDENGYKPLPKRVMKIWKRAPRVLQHNLFETCDDEPNSQENPEDISKSGATSKDIVRSTNVQSNKRRHETGAFQAKGDEPLISERTSIVKTDHKKTKKNEAGEKFDNMDQPAKFISSNSGSDNAANFPEALNYCPLCQIAFDAGMSQFDQDSHIAACLAMSNDDVIW